MLSVLTSELSYTLKFLIQLSLNGGRALEFLLETHKLFSHLLTIVNTQYLALLKIRLYEIAKSPTTKSQKQARSPPEPPQSDKVKDGDTGGDSERGTELTSMPVPSDHQIEGVECVVAVCCRCCNPYVVSGWCKLVNNLLQAFPELVGSYVHNYCVVASLTR